MSERGYSLLEFSKRIDLHCHSRASTEADEAALQALQCPECYSEPPEIYAQAKRRGMNFVTITDHDSLAGVRELLHLPDVLSGEELTCYFPQDHCKIHLLCWGITPADHDALQAAADDIYKVAQYIAHHQIAHSVAHPLYRQNDKLDAWHVQHLLLLFKGFECLNGAHASAHRAAFEPLLEELDIAEIRRLERLHRLDATGPRPWVKTRTGGSDDHGLFNVGRTWTEFPDAALTPADLLDCLRNARCRPGGQTGSSLKLAHNFYGVGIRYFTRRIARPGSDVRSAMLRKCVGEKPAAGRLALARGAAGGFVRGRLGRLGRLLGLARPPRGTHLLGQLLARSAMTNLRSPWGAPLRRAMKEGRAPLEEHEQVFDLISRINRDCLGGTLTNVAAALKGGRIDAIFDAASTILAQQALLAPYYFALFHQNQERHLLDRMTGRRPGSRNPRIGVFTDSQSEEGAAGNFALGLARCAQASGAELVVHALSENPQSRNWKAFEPIATYGVGYGLELKLPPVLDILEWADRQQFDVIVANTCGPMGLCGWLASRMLRSPMLAVLHDDAPARVFGITNRDYRLHAAAAGYAKWFVAAARNVMVRSRAGQDAARRMGAAIGATVVLPAAPREQRPASPAPDRQTAHVREPVRMICPANISSRRDMELVGRAMKEVCRHRNDVALLLIGQGQWVKWLIESTAGLPIYQLTRDPGGADLALCPDSADVSGQFAVDAQTAGVPVVAGQAGAAREFIDDDLTGLVAGADNPQAWATAILQLLSDEPRRQRMARTARQRSGRLAGDKAWETLIQTCRQAVEQAPTERDAQTQWTEDVTLSEATIQ